MITALDSIPPRLATSAQPLIRELSLGSGVPCASLLQLNYVWALAEEGSGDNESYDNVTPAQKNLPPLRA